MNANFKELSENKSKTKIISDHQNLMNSFDKHQKEFLEYFASFFEKNFEMSQKDLIDAYKKMLLIRRFEEKAGQFYGMGLIGGFCHLYIGQEAVAVGSLLPLEKGDQSITSYRDHAHVLALGVDAKKVMAELTGRGNGLCKGKSGSMHMFSKEHNFYGGHGIVGAQVSLGTGLAFANKYQGNNNVALVYFGDGAANQGQVYESFNMASLWNLPVIYIIENNQYAMGTSVKRATAEVNFVRHGVSCEIPGVVVDGMDVQAVKSATQACLSWVRQKKGPVLIDMQTYRYRGHSMSDPAQYRSKEEVQEIRENYDPIEKCKKVLLSKKWVNDEELKMIEKSVRATVNEAAQFSQSDPEPEIKELYTDILV